MIATATSQPGQHSALSVPMPLPPTLVSSASTVLAFSWQPVQALGHAAGSYLRLSYSLEYQQVLSLQMCTTFETCYRLVRKRQGFDLRKLNYVAASTAVRVQRLSIHMKLRMQRERLPLSSPVLSPRAGIHIQRNTTQTISQLQGLGGYVTVASECSLACSILMHTVHVAGSRPHRLGVAQQRHVTSGPSAIHQLSGGI